MACSGLTACQQTDGGAGSSSEVVTHDYAATVVAPTCTAQGYTLYTCKLCGDAYQEIDTAALGHDYIDTIIAPTCTASGYTLHTCSRCEKTVQDTKTAMLMHTYVETIVAPTCTAKGYTLHKCKDCGTSYQDTATAALGHTYVDTIVAPTCTAKGYTLHKCSRCGTSYQDTATAALGHTYVDTIVAPTCTAKGYTLHKCSRCSTSYKDTATAALGHTYVETVVAPTCTAKGYTLHKCSRCSTSYQDTATAALDHAWHDGEVIIAATASSDGVMTQVCTRCTLSKIARIPKGTVCESTDHAPNAAIAALHNTDVYRAIHLLNSNADYTASNEWGQCDYNADWFSANGLEVCDGLPDIATMQSKGLCCAAFVNYYLWNYLPNIAGIDSGITWLNHPDNPQGDKQTGLIRAKSTAYTMEQAAASGAGGWRQSYDAVVAPNKDYSFVATDYANGELQYKVGDILVFSSKKYQYHHVAVYAGYYDGQHWLAHSTDNPKGIGVTLSAFNGYSRTTIKDGICYVSEIFTR